MDRVPTDVLIFVTAYAAVSVFVVFVCSSIKEL